MTVVNAGGIEDRNAIGNRDENENEIENENENNNNNINKNENENENGEIEDRKENTYNKIISETGGTREIGNFIGKCEDYHTVIKSKDSSNVSNFENVGGEMKEICVKSVQQSGECHTNFLHFSTHILKI